MKTTCAKSDCMFKHPRKKIKIKVMGNIQIKPKANRNIRMKKATKSKRAHMQKTSTKKSCKRLKLAPLEESLSSP